jgi:hypothetical protein
VLGVIRAVGRSPFPCSPQLIFPGHEVRAQLAAARRGWLPPRRALRPAAAIAASLAAQPESPYAAHYQDDEAYPGASDHIKQTGRRLQDHD